MDNAVQGPPHGPLDMIKIDIKSGNINIRNTEEAL